MGFNSGGNCSNGLNGGLFYSNLNNAPSNSNWNYGASRSYGAGSTRRSISEKMSHLFLAAKAVKSGAKGTDK